jgi:Ca2+-binding EF-hand superfamily protein
MAYGSISRCVRGLPSRSRIGVLTVRAQSWEGVFRHFDKNNNNAIDGDELQQALERFGYNLSQPLQDLLKRKYGAGLSFGHPMSSAHCSRLLNLDVTWASDHEEAAAGGGPAAAPPAGDSASSGISFDRFMRACVVVKQLKESFEALDRDPYGRVKIDYDTFLRMVFKLP